MSLLDTGVVRSRAVLPEPPDRWSYSSLKEIGECPRRYALARAGYPDLWEGRGYPSLPTAPALFGNVVHGALEVVVKALVEAGVDSPQTIEATEVLRHLGGLTIVVENAVSEQLAPLDTNPRLDSDRRRRIARELRAQTSEARVRVQTYLSRTRFVPTTARGGDAPRHDSQGRQHRGRGELSEGSHAEVLLVADDLRLFGRVDLLTVEGKSANIVDYKTGVESEEHQNQLWLYALLWAADSEANPRKLAASNLIAAYPDRDVLIVAPNVEEMEGIAATLALDISSADEELRSEAPRPVPNADNCRRCAVRHLCAAYWQAVAPAPAAVADDDWFDYEGTIGDQNGPSSWWMTSKDVAEPELLLRTSTSAPQFSSGDRVRFLGLRRGSDPEVKLPLATTAVTTEMFRVEAG